jgi:hypothetical protein
MGAAVPRAAPTRLTLPYRLTLVGSAIAVSGRSASRAPAFEADLPIFVPLVFDPLTVALLAEPDGLPPLGSERLDSDQVATKLGDQLVRVDQCFDASSHRPRLSPEALTRL